MKSKNFQMISQCKIMLAGLQNFQSGIKMASTQDDEKTDKEEARIIAAIDKDIERLKSTVKKYID